MIMTANEYRKRLHLPHYQFRSKTFLNPANLDLFFRINEVAARVQYENQKLVQYMHLYS